LKIALSGYYGFDNAGDEALLSAITSTIKKYAAEAEFVVFSGHPEKTRELHGIRAVHYMNPLQLSRELFTADLLISGGGSIFQDVTSARSLPYYISVVALSKLLRKPVVFYAQGVGPINRRFSRFLMRLVGNRVDLITLRDEASASFLKELGITRPPLKVTADPVFSLQSGAAEQEAMRCLLQGREVSGQLIGISVRNWPGLEEQERELGHLLDNLVLQGYKIIFIPLAYPEDLTACRRLMGLMREDALLIDRKLSSREHLALISMLELVISVRLHALIFAASQGVPFAGISYDPKIDAFLELFGLLPLSSSFEKMQTEINHLLTDRLLHDKIKKQAENMRTKAEENARLTLSFIHN
jgi:polysaccharide pyruvyl transferase CsaB